MLKCILASHLSFPWKFWDLFPQLLKELSLIIKFVQKLHFRRYTGLETALYLNVKLLCRTAAPENSALHEV